MYDNVFKRIEEKYLLNKEQKEILFEKIKNHITKDKFYKTIVCNIYFDNLNNDLIINSLDKPIFKEKIRLRSYGVPELCDEVFLEIKNKYKGIVGKRRIKLKLSDFYKYLEDGSYDNYQIMKEINYYFKYYNLKPMIFIGYDRLSYVGIEDSNLRITIDSNLRSRRDNLRLEYGDNGDKYFNNECYIMEIKTLGSIPLWLVSVLSELKIFPMSFSKYGKIYEKEMGGNLNVG